MNDKNLKTPTTSEARERGRKGGIASGKARLRKKVGRELVKAMLSMELTDEQVRTALAKAGYDADASNEIAMHARQIEKAQKTGDTKAYNAIMRLAGYYDETDNAERQIIINFNVQTEAARQGLMKALQTGAAPRKPKDEE